MGGISNNVNASFSVLGGSFSAATFDHLSGGTSTNSTMTIGGNAQVTLPAFPATLGTSSTATIYFNGGTLTPSAASANYLGGMTTAYVSPGGASFNVPGGNNITITQGLLADPASAGGGLTLAGAGMLTLSGNNNTYSGPTNVFGGVLNVTGGSIASSAFTVNGGTLACAGAFGSGTLTNGALAPGGLTTVGTLTTGNLNIAAGTSSNYVLGSPGNGSLINAGALTLPGSGSAITVNLTNNAGQGSSGSMGATGPIR